MSSLKDESRWIVITIALSMMLGVAATAAAGVDVGYRPIINFKTTKGKLVTTETLQGKIIFVPWQKVW